MSLRRFENAVAALGPDAEITTIDPVATKPGRCQVRVDGKLLAELDQAELAQLELRPGSPWTTQLSDAIRRILEMDATRRNALRMLARRGLSRGELRERLARKGHGSPVVESIVDELEARGWLDDDAYAREVCRQQLERQAMPPQVLAARLRSRFVEDATADAVARESTEGIDFVEAAVKLGRSRLVTMRRVDPRVASRRVAGALARRGFDEEIVRAALERLELPTEDTWEDDPDETMPHGSNLES